MRLTASKNTIMLLGGCEVLLVLAFSGIIWMQQSALGQSMVSLHSKESELSDGRQVARRRDQARTLLQQDQQQIAFLESGVSDATYVPTLLKQLEELGTSTKNHVLGVRPQVVTPQPSKIQQRRDPDAAAKAEENKDEGDTKKAAPEDPYTKLVVEVNVVGTYPSTQQLLQRLTRFPKIVSVNEVSLQPHSANKDEPTGGPHLLDVKINLTAFVMKDGSLALPTAPAAVAQAATTTGGIN